MDKSTFKKQILEYQDTLDKEEIYHFQGACFKALSFVDKFSEYFENKSILDYACGMGYTSYIFSLYCNSVDAFDANPNCELVFRYNNPVGNRLRWQNLEQLKHNHYDTIFIYSIINCNRDPINWLTTFVDQMNFDTLIIGDCEKNTTWASLEDKKRRIIKGISLNYDYSLNGYSTLSIDECIPFVSNLRIIDRCDTLQFSHQPNSDFDPYRDLKNEPKKIVYVCKKI